MSRVVRVVAGRQAAVALDLTTASSPEGRLRVTSNVPAEVTVNGYAFGPAPVALEGARPGTYVVSVSAENHRPYETTCRVEAGGVCRVDAHLEPLHVDLRVQANVAAELFLDGESVGALPYAASVPAGAHRIEIRPNEAGYDTHVEQVLLRPGSPRDLRVELRREGRLAEEGADASASAAHFSRAALVTPPGSATVDLGIGYPYLLEVRMAAGIHRRAELGIAVRSFFRHTEFELRAKSAYSFSRRFSLGGVARVGGGMGGGRTPAGAPTGADPEPVNNFFVILEALATLHFVDVAAATLLVGLDTHSDRVAEPRRRAAARLRLGGRFEWAHNERWNVYALFDAVVAGRARALLVAPLGGGVVTRDRGLAAGAGVTYKFGLPPRLSPR